VREILRRLFSLSAKHPSRPGMRRTKSRGQSLVELTLTLPLILMLFSGMVEFGFMLNYYLSLLDATRFAAREFSGGDPFLRDASGDPIGDNISGFYSPAAATVYAELAPKDVNDTTRKITLNSSTDDIIISVFSVDAAGDVSDYPNWNAYPYEWNPNFTGTPAVDDSTIQNQLISGGPCEGILVVEVDYTYHQVLNLPWMFWLGSPVLPAYTIMPLQAAEPQC